jgi:NAD(P)-dependent dehydrogenase (short-subunit alcohol dehydrogenase family)
MLLMSLTKSLPRELAQRSVKIHCVAPERAAMKRIAAEMDAERQG